MNNFLSIPEYTRETIDRFVKEGVPPGHFVEAVLTNNLKEAIGHADSRNMAALPEIVRYCYCHIPMACWGNRERFQKWMEQKLKERKEREASKSN